MDAAKRTMSFGPAAVAPRDWWRAMKRGFLGRCPACGEGRLFGRFLKVNDTCVCCREPLHHHRADDLPPYLVILIVGHVVVGAMVIVEQTADWPIWLQMSIWPILTVALSLALIQPVKGAVVGLQWGLRMHGFGATRDEEAVLRPRNVGDAAP